MENNKRLISSNMPAKWRGGNEESLGYEQKSWRKRIVHMYKFITAEDRSVMDLGAGHMHLKKLLDEGVQYIPVDYKKNAEDTIVCDFNRYQFPDKAVDVIVCAGILGYIQDLEWFLHCVVTHCRKLLLSYKGKERFPSSPYFTEDIIDFLRTEGFILTECDDSLNEWTLIGCFEKAKPSTLCKNKRCTGCGACVNACRQDALYLDYDADGFLKPVLIKEKCIGCNLCVAKCPVIQKGYSCDDCIEDDSYKKSNIPVCYAAWASDEIRINSSSGGIFSVLAEEVIQRKGYVFGVEWTDGFFCRHVGINSSEDILKLRYSKYMQSNTEHTFREVKELLEKNKLVMYVGCPCQIAGLKSYLGAEYEKLILIDLVCFCSPSNILFQKYLEENYGLDNVKSVTFRAKKVTGWSPTGYRIELKDGKVLYPPKKEDAYQKAFHGVLARNDVCEECQFRGFPREGDITLGDFWGIMNHDESWNDTRGTSVVLANTAKGIKFMQILEKSKKVPRIEKVPLFWCRHKGNGFCRDVRKGHKGRKYFRQLVKKHKFNDAVNEALYQLHDIGMICMFNRNFGNNVTNFALYQVLKDMGYTVLLMDLPKKHISGISADKLKKFGQFLDNPFLEYDIAELYEKKADIQKEGKKCKFYIVASDQLWRNRFLLEGNFHAVLDWAESYKYKMSYATSFGTDQEEGLLEECKKKGYFLGRFQRLSVREKSGKKLLHEEYKIESEVVLDPIFLCNRTYFERMAHIGRIRMPQQNFLGIYALDISDSIVKAANFIEQRLGLTQECLVLDGGRSKNQAEKIYAMMPLDDAAVEEWVSMIANCSFFVTDSFHGICMALVFQKPFCVIFDKDNWRGYSRICDLLELVGLSECIIDCCDEKKLMYIIDRRIDYASVADILGKEINRSREWLSEGLKEAREWKGSYDLYDYYLDMQQKSEQLNIIRYGKLQNEIFMNKLAMRTEKFKGLQTRERVTDEMELVGWGAGNCFLRNINKIKQVYNMKYVCDNRPEKWGKEIAEGIICISPKQLSEMKNVGVIIMIDSPSVSMEIVHELMDMEIYAFEHVSNWIQVVIEDK